MKLTAHPAFDRLWTQLDQLRECLFQLWKTIDFAPGDHYMVGAVKDDVDKVQGLSQQAIHAVSPTQSGPVEVDAARAALVTAGDRLVEAEADLSEALRTRSPDLRRLGRERGPAWMNWAVLVISDVERALARIRGCIAALLDSWRELVDHEELAISTLRAPGGS
jgi:hypothetical protein